MNNPQPVEALPAELTVRPRWSSIAQQFLFAAFLFFWSLRLWEDQRFWSIFLITFALFSPVRSLIDSGRFTLTPSGILFRSGTRKRFLTWSDVQHAEMHISGHGDWGAITLTSKSGRGITVPFGNDWQWPGNRPLLPALMIRQYLLLQGIVITRNGKPLDTL